MAISQTILAGPQQHQADPVDEGIAALERAMRARAEYLSLKAHTETARIEYQAAVTDLRLISRQLGSQVAA